MIIASDCTIIEISKKSFRTCIFSSHHHSLLWVKKMNKKLFGSSINTYSQSKIIALIVCSAFFSGGCIAGVFFSMEIGCNDSVVAYVLGIPSAVCSGNVFQSYFPVLFNTAVFHILSFIFGFSLIGIVSVPLLSALKGFLAAFSVSIIVRTLGAESIWFAVSIIGLDLLVAVPCFLIISMHSLCASIRLFLVSIKSEVQFGSSIYNSKYFKRFFICCAVLVIWAFARKYLLEQIIIAAASYI